MLRITVGNNIYALTFGTHIVGAYNYLVDIKGIVAQDKMYNTRNIYTHNRVSGNTESEILVHQIEVNGLVRARGVRE